MRRAIALQGCLGLLFAFTLAPFQHVHHSHGPQQDHDHSSFIHAHFYSPIVEAEHDESTPEIEDLHDQHSASPLDTFTVVASAALVVSLPPQTVVVIPSPSVSSVKVDVVEERGHDPPPFSLSSPRSPPA